VKSKEVIEKLKEYKKCEGKLFLYNGKPIKINKVIGAPKDLPSFVKHYQEYIQNNEVMIALHPNINYDIYFFDKVLSLANGYIRLESFINHCQEAQDASKI
jgi:hypothetical protein